MSILSRITNPNEQAVKIEIDPSKIKTEKLSKINVALEAAWLSAIENIADETCKQIVLQKIGEAQVYVMNQIKIDQHEKMVAKLNNKH